MIFDDLGLAIKRMFTINFQKQPEETVLIISDFAEVDQIDNVSPIKWELINQRSKFVELLYMRAKDMYGDDKIHFIKYRATFSTQTELPTEVFEEMKKHDIIVALTTYSISYTQELAEACKLGARAASMPGFTPDMFEKDRPMAADHLKMKEFGLKLIQIISEEKEKDPDSRCQVRIEDSQKNILTFDILGNKRNFRHNFGLFHKKGSSGNLPAGDIHIAPDNMHNAHGKIAIPADWTNYCEEGYKFLEITFHDGKIVDVNGIKEKLQEFLGFKQGDLYPKTEELKVSRQNFAEFGIGLNPLATKHEVSLEAQKILGSCYIGIGTSATFGGSVKSDVHINFVLPGASIFINNKPIISNGIPTLDYLHLSKDSEISRTI